jgi:sugar O-acyltransferase (sialic acid O-acetyltransferase NeuD family)
MRVVILGAGGHGAVVAECARAGGQLQPIGFLDDDPALRGTHVLGLPVLDAIGTLEALPPEVDGVVLAVGSNRNRGALLELARSRGLDRPVVVHPRAWVSPSAQLAAGTVVVGGAMVNARAVIGPACIVNTAASVDHDCVLGEGVHVAPGARLAGGVKVGARSFIGMGAAVIEGVAIGDGCLVAAGAVVLRDLAPGERVAGVPARPMTTGGADRHQDAKR